ncbi:MAG TPA: hypothetical protein VII76_11810 [Acidimicrobiales bacterium]
MSLRRARKLKQGLDGSTMALDWRQRAMIVGVPKNARALLGQLETRALSEPEYVEHVAEIVRELEDDPAMVSFGLFHTPEHELLGVVVVVGKVGLVLLDAHDSRPYAEFRWPTLCRFDVRHVGTYQVVGLAWYDGESDITERLGAGTPLELAEMRFAYMYMHADPELLAGIQDGFDEASIPEEVHRRPPLL